MKGVLLFRSLVAEIAHMDGVSAVYHRVVSIWSTPEYERRHRRNRCINERNALQDHRSRRSIKQISRDHAPGLGFAAFEHDCF